MNVRVGKVGSDTTRTLTVTWNPPAFGADEGDKEPRMVVNNTDAVGAINAVVVRIAFPAPPIDTQFDLLWTALGELWNDVPMSDLSPLTEVEEIKGNRVQMLISFAGQVGNDLAARVQGRIANTLPEVDVTVKLTSAEYDEDDWA